MVYETTISIIAIFTVLLCLLLFIWMCKVNIFHEIEYLKKNSRRRFSMSVSTEKIPFYIEENSIKLHKENGFISMSIFSNYKFSVQICCCANINDFKRGLDSHIKRKPIDLLHLISQWVSTSIEVSDNFFQFNKNEISDDAVKETLQKVLNKEINYLVPYVVHIASYGEGSQIISLTSFIASGLLNHTLEIQEQFIEVIDGRVLSLKKLFNSGIPDNTLALQEPIEACVICHSNPVTRALVPCRHSCVCKTCFYKIQVCPVCRITIESSLQVRDESDIPLSNEEQQGQISSSISSMGVWNFIKAVWNAS
ncbi:E3 ubiquitin ligase RNF157 isoform X1 [Hydra vulgaris]|uniref:E3 ubiquitin ligase RNF157 isoform X1 n=1 Tax=Hydra vulgaris TaxID=6087 RepID=UPI000640BED7|nr:E3 ubiquitin ligase RNF157 [Hydra vulgaris]